MAGVRRGPVVPAALSPPSAAPMGPRDARSRPLLNRATAKTLGQLGASPASFVIRRTGIVRYIGNKQKLIPFIGEGLEELGIDGRTACDPFAGTASVARFLKRQGYSVATADVMSFSYVLQWAYVVVDERPRFERLIEIRANTDRLRATIDHLNHLEPAPGFIYVHFSPGSAGGSIHDRRYFTPENAARIDAVRTRLHEWRERGHLDDDEYHVLLAVLLEAADRVANTTGVYAAYVKSWQPNALKPLRLRVPQLTTGTGLECRAHQLDAMELMRRTRPFDLLYLDPPYNSRQYVGYYHIPEIIAEGWFKTEPALRGKTGLPEDGDKRSDWSRVKRCEEAFAELVATAPCHHILMSYNSEGIISEACIEEVLRGRGSPGTYRKLQRSYKRYRSDRDRAGRRYKGDRVTECLYYVRVGTRAARRV